MEIEDREYQDEDVNYAMNHGIDDKVIHCSPTGSGKTIIQAKICERELARGDSTAILTPRNEIFTQTHAVVADLCGWSNVTMLRAKRAGERWNPVAPIHIVSWPTLTSRARRSDFYFPKVKRVLVDECHLSTAPKILEILEHYAPQARIDGYTATPARQTGKGLGRFFTEIKHVTTVRQLIKDGFLCDCEYWGGNVPDLQGVRMVKGDYQTSGALSERAVELVGDAVENWIRLASDRHTIVFAVDIAHCEALANRFVAAGVKAVSLHTKKSPEQREEINRQFKSQEVQVLVNVGIASYGYDAPSVTCVQLCRPTASVVMHLQQIGRGMRPGYGDCMILDHAGNVDRLGMADDLFRWTLDEGKKASTNWTRDPNGEKDDKPNTCENCGHIFKGSRVCPECGWEVPVTARDVAVIEADLVRIGKKMMEVLPEHWPDHENFFRMLIRYGADKGYKPGWAMVKFKERCGDWPPRHWANLASMEPNMYVLNWIFKQNQNFARRASYAKRKANS